LLITFLLLINAINAQNDVTYIWSGALTPSSIKVNAKIARSTTNVRLAVSTNNSFTQPLYSEKMAVDATTNNMISLSLGDLNPGIFYYYAIEVDGVLNTKRGSFTTPQAGPFSYKFVASCGSRNSDALVFDIVTAENPLFYLNTGDLHYDDPNSSTDVNVHRTPYEKKVLSKAKNANLLSKTPIVYMWDDHDYCGNNSFGNSQGKANALRAYREYVPHYPLSGEGSVPIYQAFTIGRVRFILSDLRSARTAGNIMGTTQLAWFKNELLTAKTNKQIIAWITSVSFNSTAPDETDNWSAFDANRTEISNFLRDNNIANLFIITGDAHMLALDNGTNADFSTGKNNLNRYPIIQAASLYNSGSYKGGTFSNGYFTNKPQFAVGQYALFNITDDGGENISINVKGIRVDQVTSEKTTLFDYNFSRILGVYTELNTPKMNENIIIIPKYNSKEVIIEGAAGFNASVMDLSGKLIVKKQIKSQSEIVRIRATQGVYIVNVNGFTKQIFIN
jgi:alkaline phosphatase D